MNNQNGQIWYAARIATDQMASDGERAKNIFKGIGNEADKQSSLVDSSMKRMLAFAGGTAAVSAYVKQLVSVRSKFQQLEIALNRDK